MSRAKWPERKLRAALARGYLRTADLFAGCGGLTLGFHRAGYRCVVAVEQDDVARASHVENFGGLAPRTYAAHGDITRVRSFDAVQHLATSIKAKRDVIDIIIGGPPCQAFSRLGRAALWDIAGKKHAHVDDPRATLYEHLLAYVEDLQPIAFVMENVPEIGRFNGTNVAEEIAKAAGDLGYIARYGLLNAAWYGVPQFRERMILVGIRHELQVIPSFPAHTHKCALPSGYATSRAGSGWKPVLAPHDHYVDHNVHAPRRQAARTVGDAFADLPRITEHLASGAGTIHRDPERSLPYAAPASAYAKAMRTWPDFRSNGKSSGHAIRKTPRDYRIFRRMEPGDMYPQAVSIAKRLFRAVLQSRAARGKPVVRYSREWRRLRRSYIPPYKVTKFVNKYRKMSLDEPSRTIPAHLGKDCYSHIHPDDEQARTISVREAARLQSFPDAFELTGSFNDRLTQIGNAVPPLLAYAIGKHLRRQLGYAAARLSRQRSR